MFERFTRGARDVVRQAQAEARALGAPAVEPEHLLLATVDRCWTVARDVAIRPETSRGADRVRRSRRRRPRRPRHLPRRGSSSRRGVLRAESFRREAAQVGVTDVFLELFDATHQAIEYRYPIGLRYLAERLAP